MTTVTRTFQVKPEPAVVLDYLKDFTKAEEWDPGTESCERTDGAGPVTVGATFHNVSKIAGVSTELDYTLVELTDDTVVLVGKNDTATSTDTITVKPSAGGSEVTYRADIEMKGVAKLATPIVKVIFEKVGVRHRGPDDRSAEQAGVVVTSPNGSVEQRQAEDDGASVSEVVRLDPDEAETPISDDQAVAGYPPSESGQPDEGATGPNANQHRDQNTH